MSDRFVRQEVLSLILRETPVQFWRLTSSRMTWAYGEAFASVNGDPRILKAQKPAKLIDDRFYLAESALNHAASAAGIVSSDQKVEINGWAYTLVRSGTVSMVQSYVKTPADFSRPARFREQHAALNDFLARPQFAFGDVNPSLFDVCRVAGIVIHGPLNKKFSESDQKLGFVNFCVPSQNYKYWEVNIPLAEIIAGYGTGERSEKQRDIARPIPRRKRKGEGGEAS